MNDYLEWLQKIYADELCDGLWEHMYGFEISTLDNPGWSFRFDLAETELEHVPFDDLQVEVDENNWYHCRIRNKVFEGAGGPKNLTDILRILQNWYIENLPTENE